MAPCCTSCAGAVNPQAVIDQINALGYGLTIGIQTRIDSRAQPMSPRQRGVMRRCWRVGIERRKAPQ